MQNTLYRFIIIITFGEIDKKKRKKCRNIVFGRLSSLIWPRITTKTVENQRKKNYIKLFEPECNWYLNQGKIAKLPAITQSTISTDTGSNWKWKWKWKLCRRATQSTIGWGVRRQYTEHDKAKTVWVAKK